MHPRLGEARPVVAASPRRRPWQRSTVACRALPRSEPAAPACEGNPQQGQQQLGQLQQHLAAAARQLAKATTCVAAAAVLALGSAAPPPAEAVLNNPRAPVARTADVALRRSIPAFNTDVREVQNRLEAIGFKLRIPQRKPWQSMGDDAAAAAALVANRQLMMVGVLPGDEEKAAALLDDIEAVLVRLARSIEVKDAERTSIRVANSLEGVASLELLQAPGLPYQLPRALAGYPILAGRAVVELTVEKATGEEAFVDQNSGDGPQKQTKLVMVLDGFSAPITAANLAANFQAGVYNGTPLSVSGVSVLAGEAAELEDVDAASVVNAASPADRRSGPPAALPLEMLAAGDFEPVYRSTLDVRSGELPVLPLSIYGAVAMAHLPDYSGSGYVSGTQFFIYKFDRTQAGLAGLSFDEGEFGVVGYIVKGLDAVSKLETGDRIVAVEVVSG